MLTVDTPQPDAAGVALRLAFPALRVAMETDGISLVSDAVAKAGNIVSAAARELEEARVPFSAIHLPDPPLEQAYREVKQAL